MSDDMPRHAEADEPAQAMTEGVEEAIPRRADFKWLDEERPDGQHLRHYFEAARQVRC